MQLPASIMAEANPFSSRFVRPGAAAYLFSDATTATSLVDRLRRLDWWAQIVGPHGSGKSTLLASLEPLLQRAPRRVVSFTLHDGQRQLPRQDPLPAAWDAHTQVVVDGYEQLGWLSRYRLKIACRKRRAGLLVTAHRDVGLPLLLQTKVTLDTAWQLVGDLLSRAAESAAARITRGDVADSLSRHGSNMREILFDLYDLYERRRDHAR
jgi:hypothetical protein